MKTLFKVGLITLFFALAISARAQEVIITKTDGTILKGKVIANNATTVFIPNANALLKYISKVDILSTGPEADKFADYLVKAGITVTINGQTTESIKQSILAVQVKEPTVIDLSQSIEGFRKQRQVGKAMQLIGVLAIGGSTAMQALFNKDYKDELEAKRKNPKLPDPEQQFVTPYISIGGAALSTVGFIIDMDAGRHLKRKR